MRRWNRRIRAGGVVLAVLVPLGVPLVLEPSAVASVVTGGGGLQWVTLVTGDRVLLGEAGGQDRVVTVQPGPGRKGVAFRQQVEDGEVVVVPVDAEMLIASGRVDRRLFNVSALVAAGYDDGHLDVVPLIVRYPDDASAQSMQSALVSAGGRVVRGLPSVDGDAVEVAKTDATGFWDAMTESRPHAVVDGVSQVWLDAPVVPALDQSVPQVGAPAAWAAGYTGQGATVAVLDSGIDADHPDLSGAVVAAQDFTGSPSGTDDLVGHGTHVAGIITGDGSASGGKYVGVAPDVRLLNGKVLDDVGFGSESWVIAGMQWAAEQGADVVNMSLGGRPSDGTAPVDLALNELTRQYGTLFVVAAGNDGPSAQTVASPGTADEALTVGAVDKRDQLAEFSSRGPRLGDLALKPDITAPGVDIVSALADGSQLGTDNPVVDDRYLRLSGTSMATPHVAAAAAILAAQHPGWDAEQLKPALMGSATPTAGASVYAQGAGRLDVGRAATQSVHAATSSVDNGLVPWPHDDDEPINSAVAYRNDGTAPVTLTLAIDVRDPAGNPAPAGMFTLDAQRLTVPAGGTASVGVVTDTSVSAPDGTYQGRLTATAGQITIRTPIVVTREVESYNLTLTFLDGTGAPPPFHYASFTNIDNGQGFGGFGASGTEVMRLPAGRYYLFGFLPHTEEIYAPFAEPTLSISEDQEMVIDARQGQPAGLTVDQPAAEAGVVKIGFSRSIDASPDETTFVVSDFQSVVVQKSDSAAPGEFTFTVWADMAKPDGDGGFVGSPYLYHVQWSEDGRVPADLIRPVPDDGLAVVQTRVAASVDGQRALKDWVVEIATPGVLTEYFTPGLVTSSFVYLLNPRSGDIQTLSTAPARHDRDTTEQWNIGPFAPSVPEGVLARDGDTLIASLYLFSDQTPSHRGQSNVDSAALKLYRNGTLIGQSPSEFGTFTVPPQPATYRLEATATRSLWPLSTNVTTAWTFQSAHTDQWQPLPLMAVRFAPKLDDHNRAPAGAPFPVPIRVENQPGADLGEVTQLAVLASYDDGNTWWPVQVTGTGAERTALLNHPDHGGYVSLRATAADSRGNSVEQTIIHAYVIASASGV